MKRSFNLCRSKQVQAVLLGALLVTVSECGQKGPLYLPEKPKAEKIPNNIQSMFLLKFKLFQKKYTVSVQNGN